MQTQVVLPELKGHGQVIEKHKCDAMKELENGIMIDGVYTGQNVGAKCVSYDIEISTEHHSRWGLWQDHDLWVPITHCPFCGFALSAAKA